MPRRKTSDSISRVMRSAEHLNDRLSALPENIRENVRFLIVKILVPKIPRARKKGEGEPRPPKKGQRSKLYVRYRASDLRWPQ
jgi:hypothetical protein